LNAWNRYLSYTVRDTATALHGFIASKYDVAFPAPTTLPLTTESPDLASNDAAPPPAAALAGVNETPPSNAPDEPDVPATGPSVALERRIPLGIVLGNNILD
jgi:hypothetical protein